MSTETQILKQRIKELELENADLRSQILQLEEYLLYELEVED